MSVYKHIYFMDFIEVDTKLCNLLTLIHNGALLGDLSVTQDFPPIRLPTQSMMQLCSNNSLRIRS
jgi:hypothetical protein